MKKYPALCSLLLLTGCTPIGDNGNSAAQRQLEKERDAKADSIYMHGPAYVPPAPVHIRDDDKVTASSGWTYTEHTDEMISRTNYYASMEADNTVDLGDTYGTQTPSLTVAKDRLGTHVALSVPDGVFEDGSPANHSVLLRFDDDVAQRVPYREAADGSFNIIFLQSQSAIIARLKKASILKVEAGFYHSGLQVITFSVAGFRWAH